MHIFKHLSTLAIKRNKKKCTVNLKTLICGLLLVKQIKAWALSLLQTSYVSFIDPQLNTWNTKMIIFVCGLCAYFCEMKFLI